MATTHTFTDAYRVRLAELMFPDLTHLAVGTGVVGAPDPAATALVNEIGRTKFLQRQYVTPDVNGSIVFDGITYAPSATPTRFVHLLFRFTDTEALGSWSELGVFGHGVTFVEQGAVLIEEAVAGDDMIDVDVVLSGAWALGTAGELEVVVSTGGGTGVAQISWTGIQSGGPVPVTWQTPIPLGTTGVAILFTGGVDGLLLANDRWRVLGTIAPVRPEFASGGVYDPIGNPNGQVLTSGTLCRLSHLSPAQVKAGVFLDVSMVLEVVRP